MELFSFAPFLGNLKTLKHDEVYFEATKLRVGISTF